MSKVSKPGKPKVPAKFSRSVQRLVANDGEDRVEILYSGELYNTGRGRPSTTPTDFPCISTLVKKEEGKMGVCYATHDRGHFGVPKVVCEGRGRAHQPFVDKEGKYGLMDSVFAIVDDPENLESIAKAMDSERFRKCMTEVRQGFSAEWNRHAIGLFRKDFWKDFVES